LLTTFDQAGKADGIEAGVDMSMFGGKLNLEASVYQKKIYDFLLQENVQLSTGFSQKWVNAGDLRNQGIELSLTAMLMTQPTFDGPVPRISG
jgi:outer membrane receptor protein involved in Fe transport